MNPRRAQREDLSVILDLYRNLHPKDPVPDPACDTVREHWEKILTNPHLIYSVLEAEGVVVSTCTLAIIPNLTRGMKPYGLIENVVTAPDHRNLGHGTRLLGYALAEAWKKGCYKVMLLTGSKRDDTLRFYERAGFQRGVKTGFIAYPDG